MVAITKSDATRVLPVLKMRVGVAVDGAGFRELTGASLVDHTSGSRSVNQVPTFRGPGAVTGAKSVENVTFDLAAVQPHLGVMADLDRADRQQLNVRVRMDIYSRELFTPATTARAAIAVPSATDTQLAAKGGKVTFSAAGSDEINTLFANDEVMIGDILQIGGTADANSYIVNRVEVDDETGTFLDSGGTATGGVWVTTYTGGAVSMLPATAINKIRTAGWRQEFAGTVNQFGSIQGDASGSPSLSSGVVFTPHALLPRPTVLLVGEGETGVGW